MKEIPLQDSRVALVDDDVFERLGHLRWHENGGYVRRTVFIRRLENGKKVQKVVFLHKEVLQNGDLVDHIDGNKLNCQRSNLRAATYNGNAQNRKPLSGCASAYKGVTWHSKSRKWRARLVCDGQWVQLGLYTNEVEAARAYDRKAIELFGEFAKTNFPREDYL